LIYVQNLEIFKWECIYKNFQCVYVSCNHYMLTCFFFCKKVIDFFVLFYFIFFQEKFYLPLSFYFSVKSRPSHCREGLKWTFLKKKMRLGPWPHQAGVKINLARSEVSVWMHECVQYFSFLIFLMIVFCLILAFRKRCMSALRTYEHIHEILWWFMRMYVWNA